MSWLHLTASEINIFVQANESVVESDIGKLSSKTTQRTQLMARPQFRRRDEVKFGPEGH